MKRVRYAGGSFVTTEATASVLIRYATALGKLGRTDSVTVPCIDPGDEIGETIVLIGPSSEMMVQDEGAAEVALDDRAVVASMESSLAALTDSHPVEPLREDPTDFPRLDVDF